MDEDIVSKLDEKLKDAGFSENAMRAAKEELDTTLNKLKIFVTGRKNIFADFEKQNHSGDEAKKMIGEVNQAFTEAENQLKQVEEALNKYLNASPSFITEFLSPQGIMTKKRAVDAKINENISSIQNLNKQITDLHKQNSELTKKIEEYKETLSKLRVNEVQMQEQVRMQA